MNGAVISVAFATLLAAGSARADEPRAVEITVAGTPEEAAALGEVVAELLERHAVAPRVSRADRIDLDAVLGDAPADGALVARIWIDLRRAGDATLYVVDRSAERVLIRSVATGEALDEIAREAIGSIIEAAVDALLSGATIGISRDEARRQLGVVDPAPVTVPPPLPPPAAPQGRRLHASLGLSYTVQAWNAGSFVHGPGLALGLAAARDRRRFGILIDLQMRVPRTVSDPIASARFVEGTARLSATAARRIAERLWLRGALGAGIDLARVSPKSQRAGADADPVMAVVDPVLRAELALEVALPRGWALTVAAPVDVDLVDTSYVIDTSAGRVVAFAPWPVRPGLSLTVSFLLGGER